MRGLPDSLPSDPGEKEIHFQLLADLAVEPVLQKSASPLSETFGLLI